MELIKPPPNSRPRAPASQPPITAPTDDVNDQAKAGTFNDFARQPSGDRADHQPCEIPCCGIRARAAMPCRTGISHQDEDERTTLARNLLTDLAAMPDGGSVPRIAAPASSGAGTGGNHGLWAVGMFDVVGATAPPFFIMT
jgi:hypothetical protein